MIIIENNEARSDRGLMVKDLGTGAINSKTQVRPGCTAADFEEVEALPPYTEEQYKARVQELIAERYTTGDEIAIINNTGDGNPEHEAERAQYMAYREQCKARAREELER